MGSSKYSCRIGSLALLLFAGALCLSAAEEKDSLPREFDWTDKAYLTGSRPERLGILVVTYLGFEDRNGDKTYLDPKLPGKTAHENSAQCLSYVPRLAEGKMQKLVQSAVIEKLTNMTKLYGDVVVRTIEKGNSLKQGLEAFGERDVYIVVCMQEPEARLLVLLDGTKSAIGQTTLDCILVGKQLNPVATYSRLSVSPLDTVGTLDQKYQNAESFGKTLVEFRYTPEALVKAIVPPIIDAVSDPCLSAFRGMRKVTSK